MKSTNRSQKLFKAGLLALLVHVVFFIFMTFGLSWKTDTPAGVVVDLWSDLPQPEQEPIKKVKALPPKPLPLKKVESLPTKKAELLPPKRIEPVQPKKAKQLSPKPDIELKKEKRLAKEKKEREKKKRLAKEKKEREKKERLAKEKKERERKEKEQKARVAAETERFQKELREEEERRRLQKLAYAKAAARQNLIDEFKAKILAKIKSKIVMPPELPNDPVAEFDVTLLPGGEILEIKLRNSSGFLTFDEAVERAIIQARPLPLPKDKLLFPSFRNLSLKVHYQDD
ncbi:MAG: protein TolA [Nitrosomonadaceae bacterium]|nr:protein TolA [Nitrosomonadaceae bacterium]